MTMVSGLWHLGALEDQSLVDEDRADHLQQLEGYGDLGDCPHTHSGVKHNCVAVDGLEVSDDDTTLPPSSPS
jgi:hypothetical protein